MALKDAEQKRSAPGRWPARLRLACTVLLILAGLYYIKALLAGGGEFVIGGYEFGLEKIGDVFWFFLVLLVARLAIGHREVAGFFRRTGHRRVIIGLDRY